MTAGRPRKPDYVSLWNRTATGPAGRQCATRDEARNVAAAMRYAAERDGVGVTITKRPHGGGVRVTVERVQ